MAKSPHPALTRLAATVTARYFPGNSIFDGYYLDGRLTARREHRACDATLDREDRGFFYAAFAHPSSHGQEELVSSRAHKALERILNDVKQNIRNIDAEINELAECAVEIAGRGSLQHENARQPYFAGVMVKDAELAAITMGHGCAYLYRNDALYPLTHDDITLEPVDYHGKPVLGQDIYCAGVAGTVRYSNIAQLQPDDCVIVCNKEIITTLGQHEILRLLYEAEDQSDAAGLIITAASAKLPGVPMQIIACFVESIRSTDKPARPTPSRVAAEGGLFGQVTGKFSQPTGKFSQPTGKLSQPGQPSKPAAIKSQDDVASAAPVEPMPNLIPDEEETPYDKGYFERPRDENGRIRRLALYMVITAVTIGAVFAIFNMIFGKDGDTTLPSETTVQSETTEETDEMTITEPEETEETTPEETTSEETTAETTPKPAETTAAPAQETIHTVKSGDTFYAIAVKYFGDGSQATIDKIKDYNSLTSDNLQLGQKIKIPPQ
ncbi:MAG: LysM peptidoglycan-binding domain-containing protein [Clostridia bacterium]|nr:LysM peptidoglycan-binding domain-containing protein [Clostridia bacterium]NCC75521.1 LysM peptidoglycan-binding domain-containing protein [Clostridia bacterium]